MCVSRDYVSNWGLWEGMREIVQNQMDGITTVFGKKLRPKTMNGNGYEFRFEHDDKVYEEITFDKSRETLCIWNLGTLETGDLLLGGKTKKKSLEGLVKG